MVYFSRKNRFPTFLSERRAKMDEKVRKAPGVKPGPSLRQSQSEHALKGARGDTAWMTGM
jgi:hypothetical protein